MTKARVNDNLCCVCGNPYRKISGIWRCDVCRRNKPYEFNDGRPREGLGGHRIKPMIEEE